MRALIAGLCIKISIHHNQKRKLDVIDRIGSTIKEIRELQSHEWAAMYKALQDSAEKNAADGSSMPKDGACKEAE